MAFPTGWLRKCELVIQNGKIDDTLSNFPVLLTQTTLPAEMMDSDLRATVAAQEDGGDIRFSSDEAGSSQLACEIVTWTQASDPANAVVEIHVEVPSIASGADTSIWVWYNTSGSDSQPAEDAAYGKEDTWDDGGNDYFLMVQHLNEDPTDDGAQAIDSTQNDNDGTSGGTMDDNDLIPAKIGDGWDFDGNDDVVALPDVTGIAATGTVEAWVKFASVTWQADPGTSIWTRQRIDASLQATLGGMAGGSTDLFLVFIRGIVPGLGIVHGVV